MTTVLTSVADIMSVPRAMDTRVIGQLGQYIDTRVTETLMPSRRRCNSGHGRNSSGM
jgi:hypothetical protein